MGVGSILRDARRIGPGIIIAATGIGAGDMIAASVCGMHFEYAVLWAVIIGAVLKFVLNEGLARWQLIKGTTVLEAWVRYYSKSIAYVFLFYLLIWSFVVGGALSAACGIAAHSFFPIISVAEFGVLHSLLAVVLVMLGSYNLLERIMKWIISLLFVVLIYSAFATSPDLDKIVKGLFYFHVPEGSITFILALIGGIGGSLTILSYGYWIREKNWRGKKFLKQTRIDLLVAYLLTALFGISVMILAAGLDLEGKTGTQLILAMGESLGERSGIWAKYVFLIGFWAAVFTSMLGVWQGVPFLFNDFYLRYKGMNSRNKPDTKSAPYISFLLYIAVLPLLLLYVGKPLWIIIIYALIGGAFMPFLAFMILLMNNRMRWLGKHRNRLLTNVLLVASLLLFAVLFIKQIIEVF